MATSIHTGLPSCLAARALWEHDILISNFNNAGNLQGTGTAVDEISPNGKVKLFAQIDASEVDCRGGVG